MRRLLLLALALIAAPAFAQTPEREVDRETDRRIVIEMDSVVAEGGRYEIRVDRDEEDGEIRERRIIIRRGDDGDTEEVIRMRMPDESQLREMMERASEGALAFFRTDDGETVFEREVGMLGASPETRARMRELEAEARRHARTARESDGAERRAAEADLDRTLDELFDIRAQARQERIESLRERARDLERQADSQESLLQNRESRRRAIIDARRAELLGESDASDW